MKPVGMCRMCLVEIEGMRGLQISCATPVTDGMVVAHAEPDGEGCARTACSSSCSINHPLDCPVCDRGGECPLQDQTLAFGPGESRFVEEKRHFEKPIAISETVLLDRERCIQCGRCTRFAAEVAGDALIDFGGRGGNTEVITYPDQPFSSYFAGNTVQICPVGALTASPYRFRARPWDLETVETSCQHVRGGVPRRARVHLEPHRASARCRRRAGEPGLALRQRSVRLRVGALRRRVRAPMLRERGELVEVSWPEALDAAADALQRALDAGGPGAIAVLGGARGTNEDAYVWARFAKGVLGTDNVDAQLGDGLPAEVVLGMPRATIDDLDRAAAIVVLGARPQGPLPVLYLRVRQAAVDLGVPSSNRAARQRPHALRHRSAAPPAGRGRRDRRAARARARRRRHRVGDGRSSER